MLKKVLVLARYGGDELWTSPVAWQLYVSALLTLAVVLFPKGLL